VLFSDDARMVTLTGRTINGRAAIEQLFASSFEEYPGQTIEVKTENLRFLGADSAIEEGTATITSPPIPGDPSGSRCPFRNSAASFYCSRQAAGFVGFGRCRYGEQSHPGHSNMDVTYAFPIRGNRRANGSSARSIGKLGSSGLHSPGLGLSMPADSSCRRQGPSHQPSNRCPVRL